MRPVLRFTCGGEIPPLRGTPDRSGRDDAGSDVHPAAPVGMAVRDDTSRRYRHGTGRLAMGRARDNGWWMLLIP